MVSIKSSLSRRVSSLSRYRMTSGSALICANASLSSSVHRRRRRRLVRSPAASSTREDRWCRPLFAEERLAHAPSGKGVGLAPAVSVRRPTMPNGRRSDRVGRSARASATAAPDRNADGVRAEQASRSRCGRSGSWRITVLGGFRPRLHDPDALAIAHAARIQNRHRPGGRSHRHDHRANRTCGGAQCGAVNPCH
jgi:hypothetical protein